MIKSFMYALEYNLIKFGFKDVPSVGVVRCLISDGSIGRGLKRYAESYVKHGSLDLAAKELAVTRERVRVSCMLALIRWYKRGI